MKLHPSLVLLAAILLLAGCAKETETRKSVYVTGNITVDEQLDSSGNNSGIELIVAFRSNNSADTDTVFYAITDSSGFFSGTAYIEEADLYPVIVSRNRNMFGVANMVFADGDTISFNARLPDLNETIELSSRENDIYRTFERVDRNFSRVIQFINAGAMSADSIDIELDKWSDIYWEIYEEYPGTYASRLAGETSLTILRGLNDSLMVQRADIILESDKRLLSGSRSVLLGYYAEQEGLDGALQFLDRLERTASLNNNELMSLQIERIELLYDSARTNEANQLLNRFKQRFSDDERAMVWADNIRYDLEFLAPGAPFPSLRFQTVFGDSLITDEMTGKSFLLEITRLDNRMYQQQFDRTIAIHQIYKNFGLEIITVPLQANQVMFDAFFDERELLWTFIEPNSFDTEDVLERLNISQIPTRFLVNDQGKIIRRYVGNEYDNIVPGLQRISTQQP